MMEYLENLPPLTDVIDEKDSPEIKLKQLVKILLNKQRSLYDFKFEAADREESGIDGIVKEKYPRIECPVIFHIIWVKDKEAINKEPTSSQIKRSFAKALESRIVFRSYILVTPHNLSETEKVWLNGFQRDYNVNTYHLGCREIIGLMEEFCPALRKYYYGTAGEGKHFNITNNKYIESVAKDLRYLDFMGLPAWQYKRHDLLKSTELNEVYIPLLFRKDPTGTVFLELSEVIKISRRTVILGDPGAGKSTLSKYMTLFYATRNLQNEKSEVEKRTPFIIIIRDFARVKRSKAGSFDFVDYLKYTAEKNYNMNGIDKDFFIAMLELGKAIVLFDGLDEVMLKRSQAEIAKEIKKFAFFYPDSPVWITSRVLGYGDEVQFDPGKFDHYYIAPLSKDQAFAFIERWYQVQIPDKKDEQEFRIKSLQKAIKENEGVRRLQKNPLLLTMMALVHQFEGTLPDDRGRLYEKCIELLLKTWQDQKYISQGEENPLEKRRIRYDDQLKLLAAAAFHVQVKNQDAPTEFARGVIGEKELEEVLFNIRYDPRRIKEDHAREDIKTFLSYIRDRVGLFVDAGKNSFSFLHISFLEYLCAYQIAQDKSKSQKEHIDTLIGYMGKPVWDEIFLLALYIFSKSPNGNTFLDAFIDRVFNQSNPEPTPYTWYLLGRAVRDNISFTFDDIDKIIKELLELWLDNSGNEISRIIIDEIADFSPDGRRFLEKILKENIRDKSAPKAFSSLYFFTRFFLVDNEIIDAIKKNSDNPNLLPYLPVFRGNKVLSRFADQKLEEYQWQIYYNSIKENTCENLNRLINYGINPRELIGYIISSWSKIFNVIQDRKRFLEINQAAANSESRLEYVDFDFGYSDLKYPLNIFRHFMEIQAGYLDTPGNINIYRIRNDIFSFLEKCANPGLNQIYATSWVNLIMGKRLPELAEKLKPRYKMTPQELNQIKDVGEKYSSEFGKYLSDDLSKYLCEGFVEDLMGFLDETVQQDFTRYVSRDFSDYLSQDYKRNSTWYSSKRFSRFTEGKFGIELSRYFIRYFFGFFTQGICRDFVRDCWQKFNPEFRDTISEACVELYNKKIDWANFSHFDPGVIYDCFLNPIRKNDHRFIDDFYNYLYDYLFVQKIKILFLEIPKPRNPLPGKEILPGRIKIRMDDFMLPFIFDFILTGAFNHYIIKILADLNTKFYKNKKPTGAMTREAVEDFCRNHSFLSYITREIWPFYSKEFKEKTQPGHQLNNLRLASLLTNAAKVSLVTDMSCSGSEWDKILTESGAVEDPFVQVALTLYKISIFEDNRANAARLYEQMRFFKKRYPEYFKLIGFSS